MRQFILTPGQLTYADLILLQNEQMQIELNPAAIPAIEAAQICIANVIAQGDTVYGINTGFGALANCKIDEQNLQRLQQCLVLSHAAGVGSYLPDDVVRLLLILKINSLARGFSGVQLKTIQLLIDLLNANIYPCIPEKGSVGASGDLAPLAHLSALLLGFGQARHKGKILPASEALAKIQRAPLQLAAKEGLALLNGTQASTALALHALITTEQLFSAAIIAGALSIDAALGSVVPFDARIAQLRGCAAQTQVAAALTILLANSQIMASHQSCPKVQDPYSLRCQPQVMGACLNQFWYCQSVIMTEVNAVSDNPLVFSDEQQILSGGNFHAQAIAFAADAMAVALSEIGSIAERRIALLMDSRFSGLPAFLAPNPGLHSGFMIAHVTASALASENKCLTHPASVDSIPTSANQEDHVSMATYAARRLLAILQNNWHIISIELLAASQALDLRQPLNTSPLLQTIHKMIRSNVPFYNEDRLFANDVVTLLQLVTKESFYISIKNEPLFDWFNKNEHN